MKFNFTIADKKYTWNINKLFSSIIFVIAVSFLIWVSISWIEVVCKNITSTPISEFNFLNIIIRRFS